MLPCMHLTTASQYKLLWSPTHYTRPPTYQSAKELRQHIQPPAMQSFMKLPREIRDQICIYAVLSPTTAPDTTQSFEELTESRVNFKNPNLRAWCSLVLYSPNPPTSTVTSLLLVNKQLHSETRSNLELLAKSPYCSLDLIILDEIVLLPTWTTIPVPDTTTLNTVDVTFRIAGVHQKKKEYPYGPYKGFQIGDGAGPAMQWQIYAVLERFIRAGFSGETECRNTHKHITAKRINIDIQTPPDVSPERFGRPANGYPRRRRKEEPKTVLDPDYLAGFVRGNLGGLMVGLNYEWFNYGQILYEHLDEIVLCKDGVEIERWDVAERLKNVVPESHLSREKLAEYKEEAWALRRARGLKVLDN